jgi:hypothetical protein
MRGNLGLPARAEAALAEIEASLDAAWVAERANRPVNSDETIARSIVDHPGVHEWRLADAGLDRMACPDCGERLGSGQRGCSSCDMADGYRSAAREPDRPGVTAGNWHAILDVPGGGADAQGPG